MPDESDELKNEPLENPKDIGAGPESSGQASEELPSPAEGEHTSSKDWPDIKEIIDSGKLPGRNEMVSAIQAIPQTLFEAVQLVVSRMDKSQALQEKEHELHEKEVQLQEKEHELHERDQGIRNKEFWLKVIGILYTILWPVLVLICSHYDEIWESIRRLFSKIQHFGN